MQAARIPFTQVDWTPKLASALEDAVANIHALNACISSSILLRVWQTRAALTGYAVALRLQQLPFEEADVFAHFCDVRLPGREIPDTSSGPFDEFAQWERQLVTSEGAHWREDLPFSFELPQGWDEAPRLIRVLTLFDAYVQADHSKRAWLQLPILLRQFGVTSEVLPNLVSGMHGQRSGQGNPARQLQLLLKALSANAQTGAGRFKAMEESLIRYWAVVREQRRPGMLEKLGMLLWVEPMLRPKKVAERLGLTVSGAGKLLDRAASLGLLVEISEHATWKAYVTPDVAQGLGLVPKPVGRPRKIPRPPKRFDMAFSATATK